MNQHDEYSALRQAFAAGARIQAWHLNEGATNSNNGRWDDVEGEPLWRCAAHLYRIHPDDQLWATKVILEQQIAKLDEMHPEDAHLVQNDGRDVRWPPRAEPALDGDGYVAVTALCAHRMDESQADVWNACRSACIKAHGAAMESAQ